MVCFRPHLYFLEYSRQPFPRDNFTERLYEIWLLPTLVRPGQATYLTKWWTTGKKIAVNIVFILFSQTAALSIARDIFMVLLLEEETNQEMLIAQAPLRRNEFVCRAKQKRSLQRKARAYWKKKGKTEQWFLSHTVSTDIKHTGIIACARIFCLSFLSRVGETRCLHEKKFSPLPGLPYLPRWDNSLLNISKR